MKFASEGPWRAIYQPRNRPPGPVIRIGGKVVITRDSNCVLKIRHRCQPQLQEISSRGTCPPWNLFELLQVGIHSRREDPILRPTLVLGR